MYQMLILEHPLLVRATVMDLKLFVRGVIYFVFVLTAVGFAFSQEEDARVGQVTELESFLRRYGVQLYRKMSQTQAQIVFAPSCVLPFVGQVPATK